MKTVKKDGVTMALKANVLNLNLALKANVLNLNLALKANVLHINIGGTFFIYSWKPLVAD